MKMLFLVDGDNNIGTGLRGIEMLSEKDVVMIFYKKGLALNKIKLLCTASRADIQYIESVRSGKNSIDFQIITELGVLVGRREADYAYIISQDKGYEASISALRARYADTFREVELKPSIEDCLKLNFLLKSKNRRELCSALVLEYGSAHGGLLYNHLKQVFQLPDEESAPENPAVAVAAAPPTTPASARAPQAAAAPPTTPAPARAPHVAAASPTTPAPARAPQAAAASPTTPAPARAPHVAAASPVTPTPARAPQAAAASPLPTKTAPVTPPTPAAPTAAVPAVRPRRSSRGGRRRKPAPTAEKSEAEK